MKRGFVVLRFPWLVCNQVDPRGPATTIAVVFSGRTLVLPSGVQVANAAEALTWTPNGSFGVDPDHPVQLGAH